MSSPFQAGAENVTTYWRACDVATSEDYAGPEIPHDHAGLTLGYIRYREAAVEAVVGASIAPADIADPASTTHVDWGWARVAGPFYRVDFPDAAHSPGSPFVIRYVRNVDGIFFIPADAGDLTIDDPRAAGVTEPVEAVVTSVESAALTAIAEAVVTQAQSDGVTLTSTQVEAIARAAFLALHYAGGYGVRRLAGDETAELIIPGQTEPTVVNIDAVAGRPPVVAAGAAAT